MENSTLTKLLGMQSIFQNINGANAHNQVRSISPGFGHSIIQSQPSDSGISPLINIMKMLALFKGGQQPTGIDPNANAASPLQGISRMAIGG